MKKTWLVYLCTLCCLLCNAQDDYDIYKALEYTPKSGGSEIHIQPFRHEYAKSNLGNLVAFIRIANNYQDAINYFQGNYDEYVNLASKQLARNKSDLTDLSGKKQMKYFQKDWNTVQYRAYQADSANTVCRKKEMSADSIKCREDFVRDSLAQREVFMQDSLYRANFRKRNRYDYVVFDGPHGDPKLCYRNGKIINGKIYNADGNLEKCYADGKLIHDYSYGPAWDYQGGHIVYDAVERKEYCYSHYKTDYQSLARMRIFNENGGLLNEIWYDGNGNKTLEWYTQSFYPDGKTTKIQWRYDYEETGTDYYCIEYYSNGSGKFQKKFRCLPSGEHRVEAIYYYSSGETEYYDYNGRLERTTWDHPWWASTLLNNNPSRIFPPVKTTS